METLKAKDGYITPSHYMQGKYENIVILDNILTKEEFVGHCLGMIVKYVAANRTGENQVRAYKKAQYYIMTAINKLKETEQVSEAHTTPSYYSDQTLQPTDIIEDKFPLIYKVGYYKGQVIRYVNRIFYKGHMLDDLYKLQYNLNRLVYILEEENKNEQ